VNELKATQVRLSDRKAMMKDATIWTDENCIVCKDVKSRFVHRGFDVKEMSASDMTKALNPHVDAMAQLAWQGMALPVIMVHGFGFVEPVDIIDGSFFNVECKFCDYFNYPGHDCIDCRMSRSEKGTNK
jgi:hypothetical protein